jgi:hypothetical protein
LSTYDLAEAVGRRTVEILSRVPAAQQADVSTIAFVVRWAESDPRHQVVEVAADVGDDVGRSWRPSAFAFPSLGRFGDPADEDAQVAELWAALNQRAPDGSWDRAAGTSPPPAEPSGGGMQPLELLRGRYLDELAHGARRVRRRLRRRAGWRDQWTMFVVSDQAWDQAYAASELVNDGPLPDGLVDYLTRRDEGAVGL